MLPVLLTWQSYVACITHMTVVCCLYYPHDSGMLPVLPYMAVLCCLYYPHDSAMLPVLPTWQCYVACITHMAVLCCLHYPHGSHMLSILPIWQSYVACITHLAVICCLYYPTWFWLFQRSGSTTCLWGNCWWGATFYITYPTWVLIVPSFCIITCLLSPLKSLCWLHCWITWSCNTGGKHFLLTVAMLLLSGNPAWRKSVQACFGFVKFTNGWLLFDKILLWIILS